MINKSIAPKLVKCFYSFTMINKNNIAPKLDKCFYSFTMINKK